MFRSMLKSSVSGGAVMMRLSNFSTFTQKTQGDPGHSGLKLVCVQFVLRGKSVVASVRPSVRWFDPSIVFISFSSLSTKIISPSPFDSSVVVVRPQKKNQLL